MEASLDNGGIYKDIAKATLIELYYKLEMHEKIVESLDDLSEDAIKNVYYIVFKALYKLNSEEKILELYNKYPKFNYSKSEKIFCEVFKTLNAALPKGISKGRKNTPLNLYEAVAVGAALAYLKNGTINTEGIEEWIKDSELIKYTTGATNTKERVIKRIEYCKDKFEG